MMTDIQSICMGFGHELPQCEQARNAADCSGRLLALKATYASSEISLV